jgi:hypothetical protein
MWLLIGRGSLGATEPRIAGLMLDGPGEHGIRTTVSGRARAPGCSKPLLVIGAARDTAALGARHSAVWNLTIEG